ncbi:hypothetical protein REPUB_Repub11eG0075000 [Reevesia pubescens]
MEVVGDMTLFIFLFDLMLARWLKGSMKFGFLIQRLVLTSLDLRAEPCIGEKSLGRKF